MGIATMAMIHTGLRLIANLRQAMHRRRRRSTILEVLLQTAARPITTTMMRIGGRRLQVLAATNSPVPEATSSRVPAARIRTRRTTIITGNMAVIRPPPTAAVGMAVAVIHHPIAEVTRLQLLVVTRPRARDIRPQVLVTPHRPAAMRLDMASTKDIRHKVDTRSHQHSRPAAIIRPLQIMAVILRPHMVHRRLHMGHRPLLTERRPGTAPPRLVMGHRCPATRHTQATQRRRLAMARRQPPTSHHQAHRLEVEVEQGGIRRGGMGRKGDEVEAKGQETRSAGRITTSQGTQRGGYSSCFTRAMIGSPCGSRASIRRVAWRAPPT